MQHCMWPSGCQLGRRYPGRCFRCRSGGSQMCPRMGLEDCQSSLSRSRDKIDGTSRRMKIAGASWNCHEITHAWMHACMHTHTRCLLCYSRGTGVPQQEAVALSSPVVPPLLLHAQAYGTAPVVEQGTCAPPGSLHTGASSLRVPDSA